MPYEQYLVYAKIANLCRVRLDCGTYKMRFGEVCLKKESCWAHDEEAVKIHGKYYHDFPIGILPETCRTTAENHLAVLACSGQFYLCIWDRSGTPRAVHLLADAQKIISVSVTNQNHVEVVCQNSGNKHCRAIFACDAANQTAIVADPDRD